MTFSLTGYSQSYIDLILKADTLYEEDDFKGSAELLDQALALKIDAGVLYNAACSWALAGNTETAVDYLFKALDNGLADIINNVSILESDEDLEVLHKHSKWQDLIAKLKNELKYNQPTNMVLKDEIEELEIKDQTLRQLLAEAEEKLGTNSASFDYFKSLIMTQDSLNAIKIASILDIEGWPGKSLVGSKANKAFGLVIRHAPLELQDRSLPLLKSSVASGQSAGTDLAYLTDRVLLRNGMPQVYGTQLIENEQTGQLEVYKIKDPANVNMRRKEIGLESIESYLAFWKIDWIGRELNSIQIPILIDNEID